MFRAFSYERHGAVAYSYVRVVVEPQSRIRLQQVPYRDFSTELDTKNES
ncbi:hypothetical protein FACS1894199_19210 [Bacteroidia bacterium]|nr:hypothetical protein FACS1894199_19210 [Bacteroidia bacterium]